MVEWNGHGVGLVERRPPRHGTSLARRRGWDETDAHRPRLALESEGWVVWGDRAEGVEAEGDALQPGLFAPRGPEAPSSWWASRHGEAPVRTSGLDQIVRNAGIPSSTWATRWEGGGRWFVGAEWRQDLERLAREQGWSIGWEGNDVVVNGNDAWEWSTIEDGRLGQTADGVWRGTLAAGGTVLWTGKSDMAGESAAEEAGPTDTGSRHGPGADVLGRVRNHRTQTTMEVRKEEGTMAAFQQDGEAVWRVDAEEEPLAGGAVEVDVYANGKYQAMFCLPSGLHLLDVKGREVPGFPRCPTRRVDGLGLGRLRRNPELQVFGGLVYSGLWSIFDGKARPPLGGLIGRTQASIARPLSGTFGICDWG